MLKEENTTKYVLCEGCEKSSAAFLCKADSASLCSTCVPILKEDADDHQSWLFLDNNIIISPSIKNYGVLFGGEDQYLDSYLCQDNHDHQYNYNCHVVPVDQYNYGSFAATSFPDKVLEMGVVPNSNPSTLNDISSDSHMRSNPKDIFSGMPQQQQLTGMDREARVLRYKEKKKRRKFDKKIRYASRKACAEIRPRIKGRFAKRATNLEVEIESTGSYGVVPISNIFNQ